jgi:hypothetical protein
MTDLQEDDSEAIEEDEEEGSEEDVPRKARSRKGMPAVSILSHFISWLVLMRTRERKALRLALAEGAVNSSTMMQGSVGAVSWLTC